MRGIDRRFLLRAMTAGIGLAALPALADPVFRRYPFSLGVASGDPRPDGVVLWTRIAPEPLEGGGMPMQPVEVAWELASDDRFRTVVRKGTETARPELAHSVHVEVDGLEPGRDYWYRFQVGKERSAAGRTRTAPAAGSPVERLRFAVAGCQHYEQGLFTAFRHLAAERLDFVFHYGDYIYEGRESGPNVPRPRLHRGDEIYTLVDYRNRYAQYKIDRDLQAAHASTAWIASFDDHEIDNNWARDRDDDGTPPEVFLLRRAAAFQAWYEHMPVRRALLPHGPDLGMFRRFAFGGLLDLHVLDTRQYRTDQPCGDRIKPRCADAMDPNATILGSSQKAWLFGGLAESRARWNALAQQVMIGQVDRDIGAERRFDMDKWDGYVADRQDLIGRIAERRQGNVVALSGDAHKTWIGDLVLDFDDPASPPVASEFVSTSISSGGDGVDQRPDTPKILAQNPHWKFYNDQRGYLSCTVTPERWQTDVRIVPFVSKPDAPVSTRASFVVEHGRPGVQEA